MLKHFHNQCAGFMFYHLVRNRQREPEMLKNLTMMFALFTATAALADELDALVGAWQSPDGFARMKFDRAFDGSWVEYDMWFSGEAGWKHVARGVIYPRPGAPGWQAVARSRDMDGIELFESLVTSAGEGQFHWVNKAWQADGTLLETTENWQFEGPDRFHYQIFQDDDEQHPWMTGSWVRITEE